MFKLKYSRVNSYYNAVIGEKLYSSKRHLKFKTAKLFKGIKISGKTVLDVGGGDGLFTFYAASQGAKKVICLEPECDGSYGEMTKNFEKIKSILQLENAQLIKSTFQDYNPLDEKFDIVLMHNSINHLDEGACERLTEDKAAWEKYLDITKKINSIANPGAKLLVCDCSNENFFAKVGIKNIFAPTIQWSKHQKPETWIKLLRQSGFYPTKLNWNSPKQLGNIGYLFLGNKFLSYFLGSHFRLVLTKS